MWLNGEILKYVIRIYLIFLLLRYLIWKRVWINFKIWNLFLIDCVLFRLIIYIFF